MPNKKVEAYRVPRARGKDKRIKLTQEQRDEIAANQSGLSQRSLAKKYGVSRRLIGFILYPDKLRANIQRRQEAGGWKRYYNKEKHRLSMKAHRQHKAELIKKESGQ